MMLRTFMLLLVGASVAVRASDLIDAPAGGASAMVSQPHVTAELIPEVTTVDPGQPFDVALHLHSDPGWHTYWINPGDAGLATTITWTLPPGFSAGPIQWPVPEKHAMGPLVTYGYEGDVYLLTTITPPKSDLPRHFDVKAHATWLVCQEECIPGKADLTVTLDSGSLNLRLPVDNSDFFNDAKARLPVENTRWEVKAAYGDRADFNSAGPQGLNLILSEKTDQTAVPKTLRFFPEQPNVLANEDNNQGHVFSDNKAIQLSISLQQNGEKPDKLSGVLVSDEPLIGDAKAVYIAEFPVASLVAAAVPSGGSTSGSNGAAAAPPLGTAAATTEAATEPSPGGRRLPTEAPPLLIVVLGGAFIGGLILNLMPCVLPVLSLKVFSLMKHAGDNPKAAWIQGAAFTAGVVVSFWVLAGVLLFLQAAGSHLGWGFQMQSPGFVLALIFLFFLLGLNLLGVFELGTSLVGLDARATGRFHGTVSSFLNGALATVAATPCTAPFMGSSVGFAAQQPPFVAMLVFTFLALGMASPYLLLTLFPGALRFVPKPGAWMEAFRQFMGFLLMATVIFLIYVFGALVGGEQIPILLFILLLTSVAGWIYGRWGAIRTFLYLMALVIIYGTSELGLFSGDLRPIGAISFPLSLQAVKAKSDDKDWQPWSPEAVHAALAQGRPVFVDFTAAWCLSCKVNERVALDTDAVKQAFTEKNVALFQADWTHPNTDIANELQKYNRDGVPLYLLYSPKNEDAPQILPEVLTPGIVLDAVKGL